MATLYTVDSSFFLKKVVPFNAINSTHTNHFYLGIFTKFFTYIRNHKN